MEALALAGGGIAVDGDRAGGGRAAHDIEGGRAGDGGVLIPVVSTVSEGAQAGSAGVATGFRGDAVADGVVVILELVAGEESAAREVFFAGGEFATPVVAVVPVGAVLARGLGAAAGGVIGLAVACEQLCSVFHLNPI